MSANHIMLDTETLGQRPGCVIMSVAAVQFDPNASIDDLVDFTTMVDENGPPRVIAPCYYQIISVNDQSSMGAHIDPGTLSWWLNQDPDLFRKTISGTTHPNVALLGLVEFITKVALEQKGRDIKIWSHGKTFDPPLFDWHYETFLGRKAPWEFRNVRDTRTLFDLAGQLPREQRNDLNLHMCPKHHALWDSIRQAVQVQDCYAKLGIITPETQAEMGLEDRRTA